MTSHCFLCDVASGERPAEMIPLKSNAETFMAFYNPAKSLDDLVDIIIAPREHLLPLQKVPIALLVWLQAIQVGRDIGMGYLERHSHLRVELRFENPPTHAMGRLYIPRDPNK